MAEELHFHRREDADRITRLEVVVGRIEVDVSDMIKSNKEDMAAMSADHKVISNQLQTVLVESIRTTTSLQSSIEKLNTTLTPLSIKVDEHDQFIWKALGFITALNMVGWVVLHFIK